VHVTEEAGAEIVRSFAKTFGLREERDHPEFLEREYLIANPDVRSAVTAGQLSSGYDHWLAFGRAEGRPLRAGGAPGYR
jgi:hypothetical protein